MHVQGERWGPQERLESSVPQGWGCAMDRDRRARRKASKKASSKGEEDMPKDLRRLSANIVGIALLVACSTACDDATLTPVQQGAGQTQQAPAAPSPQGGAGGSEDPRNRIIPPEESRIRTIVGEVLEDRDDAVGEWARKKRSDYEEQRKAQRWLQPIDYDFGKQRVGSKLEAELELFNPTGAEQKLTGFSKSCKCQSATLVLGDRSIDLTQGLKDPVVLAPGEKGKVIATIVVPDQQSRLTVALRFETSDPNQPLLDAQLHVDAVRDLHVLVGDEQRDSIDFGELAKDSVRDFVFRVVSRDGKPFQIESYEKPLPVGVAVAFEKAKPDASEWFVRGKLGPGLPENRCGGTVAFETDRGKFEVRVYASVLPPLRVTPSEMVVLGVVPVASGAKKDVRFDVVDPSQSVAITKVEWFDIAQGLVPEGASFEADIDNAEGGKSATLHVRIPRGLARGRFQIGMLVHFAGEDLEPRKVRFIGHAR